MISVTNDVKYIGVNDHNIDLFEGQFEVPNGMAYNSYMIIDNEVTVLDTVDSHFTKEWLENIKNNLGDKKISYLIIQHMEPDHSGSIADFMEKNRETKIVSTMKSFAMMKQFFGNEYEDRRVVVKEGDTISLGNHVLKFIMAPMVHWPEVMVTFDEYEKILFSADGFGKFGVLDTKEDWACEARRYYMGIVGKFGMQVQSLLKKVSLLEIKTICPLHGPILTENLGYYINLYDIWSSYKVESDGVMIAYTSIYGNTKKAVEELKSKLEEKGCKKVVVTDLARCDMAEAVEDAFRYGKLVLATTTYNNEIFPFMREFINNLVERNYQNRTVAFIENGSWAPAAIKFMKAMLEKSKNIQYIDTEVTIKSSLIAENMEQIDTLAGKIK